MTNKICQKFLHLIFIIFSLLFLWLKITTSTSVSHKLVAASDHYKCIDKERDALLDIKARIQDHNGILSTWTSEKEECCKWYGVTCNNHTGHVTQLDLSNFYTGNSLGGKINPSLLNLSYLSHLDLAYNSFTGIIPQNIGSMTQLSYIDISHNFFSGTIPTSIGSLTELRYLIIGQNSFSGSIPTSIGSLTKLTHLILYFSYLSNETCIPPEFGNLTNLQILQLGNLASCTLENIDWLSNMSDLNNLVMDSTSLVKANKWVNVILSLQKLSYLSLNGCDLSQVMHPYSSSFVNSSSSSIVDLYLTNNNLNSSMYHWFLPLTSNKLRTLDLSGNMLDFKSFGNLCSLTSLSFSNSVVIKFSDFLNTWSGCTSVTLQSLYASHSQFVGSLTDEIKMFSSLEFLELHHNELTGLISEKLWELPMLETLDISSNYLRDAISENIGRSKLLSIDLSNNSLKGVLSKAHMSNLSDVDTIDLSF